MILTLGSAVWSATTSPTSTPRPVAVASRSRISARTTTTTTTTTTPSPVARVPDAPMSLPATDSDWQVSAAYPAVPGVQDMACPSISICYAAGTNSSEAGDVVATTDSG